ncbi:hypothetical protein GOV13_01305 [Candidatus Pacearchaeota archaeon]|nr:hypothetical protein [Candidatus Pacearchaeota archaeon]
MKVEHMLVNSLNTFGEVDSLRVDLSALPHDYDPFPNLKKDEKIGVMRLGGKIHLSPMGKTYEGAINFPHGAEECEALDFKGDQEIIIGAKFTYKVNKYVMHRTRVKHDRP